MKITKVRLMHNHIFRQYVQKLGHVPTCFRCNKPIETGEQYNKGSSKTKFYCQNCYDSMFVDIPDEIQKKGNMKKVSFLQETPRL